MALYARSRANKAPVGRVMAHLAGAVPGRRFTCVACWPSLPGEGAFAPAPPAVRGCSCGTGGRCPPPCIRSLLAPRPLPPPCAVLWCGRACRVVPPLLSCSPCPGRLAPPCPALPLLGALAWGGGAPPWSLGCGAVWWGVLRGGWCRAVCVRARAGGGRGRWLLARGCRISVPLWRGGAVASGRRSSCGAFHSWLPFRLFVHVMQHR
jgi:hypothetical protein